MSCRILVVPDKFKGTLTAGQAAWAIADGWKRARPTDIVELLPMSDGGDGFGEVLSPHLDAKAKILKTVDAAGRPIRACWWWNAKDRIAVIESARVIGLARLPQGHFHPFQLDTRGLAKLLMRVTQLKANTIYMGLGGSATNDGGFGLALALGWRFLDDKGDSISEWWRLNRLVAIKPPTVRWKTKIIIGVDVKNPLLGLNGCSRIYGPQKGLHPDDIAYAETCLRRLQRVVKKTVGMDYSKTPGAGAAGGLGFGLMSFLGATCVSGFELFAHFSNLKARICSADLVITGEGAIDAQTFMGKGVGEVVRMCRNYKVPCLGLAGRVDAPEMAQKYFTGVDSLIPSDNPK